MTHLLQLVERGVLTPEQANHIAQTVSNTPLDYRMQVIEELNSIVGWVLTPNVVRELMNI